MEGINIEALSPKLQEAISDRPAANSATTEKLRTIVSETPRVGNSIANSSADVNGGAKPVDHSGDWAPVNGKTGVFHTAEFPEVEIALQDAQPGCHKAGSVAILQVVTQKWLNRKRKKGVNHRDHFQILQDEPGDIPLTIADVELLPSLWRNPDAVEKVGQTRIMLSMKSTDGGTYKAVVDCGKIRQN